LSLAKGNGRIPNVLRSAWLRGYLPVVGGAYLRSRAGLKKIWTGRRASAIPQSQNGLDGRWRSRMRTRLFIALSLVMMLVFVASCAKAPQDQVAAAQASLKSAQDAEAGTYAKDAMANAEQQMAALDEEMKAQQGKFALFRSYGKTKELAAAAQAAADSAKGAAQEGKARARDEATAAINDAKALADSTNTMLAHAPVGKGSMTDIQAMKQDMSTVMMNISEADSAFAAEQYNEAKAKADAAKSTAQGIQSSIMQAREMAKGHH